MWKAGELPTCGALPPGAPERTLPGQKPQTRTGFASQGPMALGGRGPRGPGLPRGKLTARLWDLS